MSVSIRRATRDDASTIVSIGREAFTAAYGPHNTTEDLQRHLTNTYTTETIEQELNAGCRYLIADVEGVPAGFGKLRYVSAEDRPQGIPGNHPIEIHQLYFLPSFQRRGVGGRLVTELGALALSMDGDGLYLGVWEKADWAIGFYEKCGMTRIGTKVFRVGNDDQSDHLMYLPLK